MRPRQPLRVFDRPEQTVRAQALELTALPASQLAAMKLIVTHACEQQGLGAVQTLGPVLDGLMRNIPTRRNRSSRAGVAVISLPSVRLPRPGFDTSNGDGPHELYGCPRSVRPRLRA